jgi:enoyl-CoA hydratase
MDYSGGYKDIIYQPGRVTRIIINRPQYKNAISHPTYGEIENAVDRFTADRSCRVLVISGAGSCFSAGHDAFGLTPDSAPMLADRRTPEQLVKDYGSEKDIWGAYDRQHQYFLNEMHLHKFHRIPKPTIAMVHGYCVWGGFFLAGVMDIVFASEDALFLTEVGQCDPGTWDFGPRKMLEIIYEHRFLTARECKEMHFVNRIYPDFETLERETLAFANRVADNEALAFTSLVNIKKAVYHTRDLQGFRTACEDAWVLAHPGSRSIDDPKNQDKHGERSEGRGMARTPRALENLRIKLESQGEPVPQGLLDALARAKARDDKAAWKKTLNQTWRDPEKVKEGMADFEKRTKKEPEKK